MFFGENLGFLRKTRGLSQQELADLLGLKKSTLAGYETNRAEPRYEDLIRLARFFSITLDELLKRKLSDGPVLARDKDADLRVLVTTVGPSAADNIEHVPVRALGGYAEGFGDVDYVQQLPAFRVPFLDAAKKYRSFPYEGDSMPPLRSGCVVFGEYVENWYTLRHGTICIVVTRQEGVVVKQVFNYLKEKQLLLLHSLSQHHAPYVVELHEIREIWRFAGYFDTVFPQG